MASIWREAVRDLIGALPSDTFSLAQLYARSGELRARFPGNSSIEDTLRRVLQELRDMGELNFVSRGLYERLAPSERVTFESLPALDDVGIDRSAEPGAPESVQLEKRSVDSYTVSKTEAREALRREWTLVTSFAAFLKERGHIVQRNRISTRSSSYLFTDVWDATSLVLYEAKSDATRESVRTAIGQLLDYGRYLNASSLSVLLPTRPSEDMLELLRILDLGCAYADGSTFEVLPGGRPPVSVHAVEGSSRASSPMRAGTAGPEGIATAV